MGAVMAAAESVAGPIPRQSARDSQLCEARTSTGSTRRHICAVDARAPTRQCCCTASAFDCAVRMRCRFWGLVFRPGFRHRQWAVVHLRREMEARDTHVPSTIRRGDYHTTGCRIPLGVTEGRRACWRLREGLPAVIWEIDVADGSGYLGGEARAQTGWGGRMSMPP
ncbi:hypothetical protein PIB30_024993 [Stylosanthes scabra]|uniref:Uncharacterized protein n=1 Tax=Stylosanthes scabra TaxID=79078 RepID=A0ABU6YBW1_9FABA|nr:hypothetical protein [Stylosanthes scabra]